MIPMIGDKIKDLANSQCRNEEKYLVKMIIWIDMRHYKAEIKQK